MAQEIELKFLCEPSDLEAVLAQAGAAGLRALALHAVYFDTPDGDLARRRIALRVRTGEGEPLQTFKEGEGFARIEVAGPSPDGGLDRDMPVLRRVLKPPALALLEPAFQVDVSRRQIRLHREGADIELAGDLGEIRTGARRAPVCELELELKAGPPGPLFDLARELSRIAPLFLSFDSKAARGQALAAGDPVRARNSEPSRLSRQATAGEAFQGIARQALSQISANGLTLRDHDSIEALHQLRVALRRLRSAMSTFRPVVDDTRRKALAEELRWLSRACDEARDLDVFANDNAALGGGRAFAPSVEAARLGAHAKAQAAVASKRFRDLLLDIAAFVETGAWRDADGRAARRRDSPARTFAAKALSRRWRKLVRPDQDLAALDDDRRHRVRIAAKKLRYALEAFAPLFPTRPTAKVVSRLKTLQDELGALNDAAVAARLVQILHPEGEELAEARQLMAARSARRTRSLKAAARALDRLAATKPPWAN